MHVIHSSEFVKITIMCRQYVEIEYFIGIKELATNDKLTHFHSKISGLQIIVFKEYSNYRQECVVWFIELPLKGDDRIRNFIDVAPSIIGCVLTHKSRPTKKFLQM